MLCPCSAVLLTLTGQSWGARVGSCPCPPEGWRDISALCCPLFAGNRDWGAQKAGQLWMEGPPEERDRGPQARHH